MRDCACYGILETVDLEGRTEGDGVERGSSAALRGVVEGPFSTPIITHRLSRFDIIRE